MSTNYYFEKCGLKEKGENRIIDEDGLGHRCEHMFILGGY